MGSRNNFKCSPLLNTCVSTTLESINLSWYVRKKKDILLNNQDVSTKLNILCVQLNIVGLNELTWKLVTEHKKV